MSPVTIFSSMNRSLFEHHSGKQTRRPSRHARQPRMRLECERLEARTVLSAVADVFGSIPLSFEPFPGQADARVQFGSHGPGYGLSLTATEAVLALNRSTAALPLSTTSRIAA